MRWIVTAALLLAASAALAQFLNPPIGPGSIVPIGPSTSSGGVTPPSSCAAGQLDFSDATGCNTTLYMVILR